MTPINSILLEREPYFPQAGLGYDMFIHPSGCSGLAKDTENELDILGINASIPGTGQFRNFIAHAKLAYPSIVIREVWNPALEKILSRYGFVHVDDEDSDFTWRWRSA